MKPTNTTTIYYESCFETRRQLQSSFMDFKKAWAADLTCMLYTLSLNNVNRFRSTDILFKLEDKDFLRT